MTSKQFYTNLVNPNPSYNAGNNGSVANPMTVTLDCAQNSIINLPEPVNAGDAVNLSYLEATIPNLDEFVSNPLTETLNANNNIISNVVGFTMKDAVQNLTTYSMFLMNGGVATVNASDSLSVQHCITINETEGKPYFTDFRSHGVTNLSSVGFSDGGVISIGSSTFQFNHPVDLNNNYIKDVQYLEFYNGGSLDCDPSDNLTYNSDIVVTSANIDTYIAKASWEATANSDLEMDEYNINLSGGKVYLSQQLALTAESDSTLTYGGCEVIVRKPDISETISFTEYSPTTSVNVNVEGGFPMSGSDATIGSSDINLSSPTFDVNVAITTSTSTSFDITTAYVIIGLCDQTNPVNSDHTAEFLKVHGACFTSTGSGNYFVKVNTGDSNPNVDVLMPWSNVWTALTVNTAYVYASMYAQTGSGGDVYIGSFVCSINVVESTSDNDFYLSIDKTKLSNGIVTINNASELIQTYQGVSNVSQTNGLNNLYTVNLPTISGDGLIYLSGLIASSHYVVKIKCIIQNGSIVSGSNTATVIFEQGNVLTDATFVSENGHIIVQNTIAAEDEYNNATVKVKIIVVDY